VYQNIFIERGEGFGNDTVHLWDDELGYKTIPYKNFDYAYKADRSGNHVSMTGVRLAKVKRYKRDDPNLFESDLPQETRVLTDLYLNEDNPSTGHKVMFFDIEVSMENGVPKIDNPNNEITSIAVYDAITQEYSVLVLDKAGVHPSREYDNVKVVMYTSELDLLYGFLDLYEQIGPTIITGWNSDYFDVPYLYNRIKQQCGPNTAGRLSPIGKLKYSKFRSKYQIAGVSSLDYLDLYKKFTYNQQPNYRLDTIGRLEVNMGKIEYEGSLDELFRNDLQKFIEYNLQDVRIIVEMDKKLKLIELVRGICHLGHVTYEDYSFSSKFLEGTIVTYLHRKGIIVTNKPAGGREMMNDKMENEDEGFAGAYVKEPKAGLYEWIYSLDLQSLYPSIIMSLNISPETKIGFVTNWNVDKHVNGELNEYLIRGTHDEEVVRLSREAFMKYMKMENLMISSNGVLYNGKSVGIIPEVLDKWFAERVEYKNLMKKYKNEGNAEMAEFYDRRQHIQKIFLNSLYGVLGLPIFRFFDIDNALAVTATGQDVIKKSAEFANNLYWNRLNTTEDYCTYIDTDSLYFSALPLMPENVNGKEFTIKLARAVEKKLNEYYSTMANDLFFCNSHRFYIKGESVAETGIWIAKKRYAMNVVYDLESNLDVANKMKVKGLDVVRSSFPPAFRDFMNGMMKDILNKTSKAEIDKKILDFRSLLDTMDYLNVARNTSVKNISEYDMGTNQLNGFKKGTPAHVKAALTYNALLHHFKIQNRYESIEDGAKVKWVYLMQNPYNLEAVAIKGYNDPPQIIDLVKTYIDYNALFENELQKKLEDFYSALRWGNIPTEVNQNASEWFDF
jgi:DNA polymerase elongation subunit (family B)